MPPLGALSLGMIEHIVLMNLVAPLAALALARRALVPAGISRGLALPTLVQLALLWGWHAPPALDAAMHDPLLHGVMQATLALSALWFWGAVFAAEAPGRWRPVLALLITSKLFCLLGVLLAFAPRGLYAVGAS